MIDQKDTTADSGDCFRACLSNLLNIDLSGMRLFLEKDSWLELYNLELSHSFGLDIGIGAIKVSRSRVQGWLPNFTRVIVSVASEIHPGKLHAVLAEYGHDGHLHIIYDPNPIYKMTEQDFQSAKWEWVYFAVIHNPAYPGKPEAFSHANGYDDDGNPIRYMLSTNGEV